MTAPTPSTTHLVLIPSYDSGALVVETVRAARAAWDPVWVVFDGSTDGSDALLERAFADDAGVRIFRLPVNRGKGAAVLHGLQAAQAEGFTHALTMDADGQHPADHIARFMGLSIARPGAMILGRPMFAADAPALRVQGRKVSNFWTNLETLWAGVDDSLFGFRVYPIAPLIAVMRGQPWMRRFDFDVEAVVRLCWRGVQPVSTGTPVRYLSADEGGVSHFNYLRDNVLLTWMHARLFLGFVLRLPWLLWRRLVGPGRIAASGLLLALAGGGLPPDAQAASNDLKGGRPHDARDVLRGDRAGPCDLRAAAGIPPRPASAPGWRALSAQFARVDPRERERLITEQLAAGNLPATLRRLRPVELAGTTASGRPVRVVTCVMPDYLAIGSDEDALPMPMALAAARTLAHRFGLLLPTRRIVDAVHAQADLRLEPQPLPPGPRMRSTDYYVAHGALIRAQRDAIAAAASVRGASRLVPPALAAGHKKDLVATPRLWTAPGRIAIYGWHRGDGRPIQPLSTVHGERYADYSHGVRLVGAQAFVDGVPRSLYELLADPEYAPVLSDEGPMPELRRWIEGDA